MTSAISAATNNRINTCPHGMPVGACPICNGKSGGGSTQKTDQPRRPGEMTYQECYAQWMRMQRADAQKQAQQEMLVKNAELAQKFKDTLNNVVNKLSVILNQIQASLPAPVAKVFSAIANNIIKPLVNLIQKLPNLINNIQTMFENAKNVILQAQEKLSAILGEVKNFIERKISNSLNKVKQKLGKLLSIFEVDENYNEYDEELKEKLRVFEELELKSLKEAFRKLLLPKHKEDEIAKFDNKYS